MQPEISRLMVQRAHHRRGRRDDAQCPAAAHPVVVPVAMQHHDPPRVPPQPPQHPMPVDQGGTDALRERRTRARIFHQMVVQRDQPARLRPFAHRRFCRAKLAHAQDAERVGEGKCVSALNRAAPRRAHRVSGRGDQRKASFQVVRAARPARSPPSSMKRAVSPRPSCASQASRSVRRACCRGRRRARAAPCSRAMAERKRSRRRRLARCDRQFQPRRIGAIDDVHVVIAGMIRTVAQRMAREGFLEGDELGIARGIGDVAGDQHDIEALHGILAFQQFQHPVEPLIAARPVAPAFVESRSARQRGGCPTDARRANAVRQHRVGRCPVACRRAPRRCSRRRADHQIDRDDPDAVADGIERDAHEITGTEGSDAQGGQRPRPPGNGGAQQCDHHAGDEPRIARVA